MTEYDYSYDAYERYLSTQRRIARWVEDISRHPLINPFVTSPTEDSSWNAVSGDSHSPERSCSETKCRSTSNVAQTKPEPPRSYASPILLQRSAAESSSPPRSTQHSRRSSLLSTSHRTSRSKRTRSNTTSTFKTITPNSDGPTYIKHSNSQSILIPIDGARYVIIPAKGTRLEAMMSTCLLLLSILAWWISSDT